MKRNPLINNIPKALLALSGLNLISGIMHLIFHFHLIKSSGPYREFLLIENLLICIVFIFFSLFLIISEKKQKEILLSFQLVFWSFFLIILIFFWGSVTTLSLFKSWVNLPESMILAFVGVCGIIMSIHSRFQQSKT